MASRWRPLPSSYIRKARSGALQSQLEGHAGSIESTSNGHIDTSG
jgi:hypothetical protein